MCSNRMQVAVAMCAALLFTCDRTSRAEEAPKPVILKGHKGPITMSAPSAKEQSLLATASEDKSIRLWDVRAGKQLAVIEKKGKSDAIESLLFSPDGKFLLATRKGETASINIWDLKDLANPVQFDTLEGHSALGFSPDSKFLYALGSKDNQPVVFQWGVGKEFEKNEVLGPAPQSSDAFLATVYTQQIIFSPDGSMFAVGIRWKAKDKPDEYSYGFGSAALAGDVSKNPKAFVNVGAGTTGPVELGFFTASEPYCFKTDGRLLRWKLTKKGLIDETLPEATFGGEKEDFRAARLVPGTKDQFVTVRVSKDKEDTHFQISRWVLGKDRAREAVSTEKVELSESFPQFVLAPDCSWVAVTGKDHTLEVYLVGGVLGVPEKK